MSTSLPVVFLACGVFKGILKGEEGGKTLFLDQGLHVAPKKLQATIQERIDAIEEPSLILLGYGLCGNGLNKIKAGLHTLVIPKADDCVAVFMGSRKRYLDDFMENTGTYYLTKGWFAAGANPLSEYHGLVEKYDTETADWLMEQQYTHYKRLLFVAHTEADLEEYRPQALEVATFCERFGMVYEEFLGGEKFVEEIATALKSQENLSSAFILIPPGGSIEQENFR